MFSNRDSLVILDKDFGGFGEQVNTLTGSLDSLLLPGGTGLDHVDENAGENFNILSKACSSFGAGARLDQESYQLYGQEPLVDRTRSFTFSFFGVSLARVFAHEAPEEGLDESPSELGAGIEYILEEFRAESRFHVSPAFEEFLQ
jgi:hypothetical protein